MLRVESTGSETFPPWLWGVPCLALAVLFFFASAVKVWLYFATRRSSFPSPWSIPLVGLFFGAGLVHLLTYLTTAGVNAVAFLVVYWFTAVVGVFGVVGMYRSGVWLGECRDRTEAEIAELEKRLAALVEVERMMKATVHANPDGVKNNVVG